MTPGEIAPEQTITILDERDDDDSFHESDLFGRGGSRRSSLTGLPMRVLAVDLPFVLVEVTLNKQRISLDTRLHDLMELKPEFVKAFEVKPEPEPESAQHPLIQQMIDAHNVVANEVARLSRLSNQPPPPPPVPPKRKIPWTIVLLAISGCTGIALVLHSFLNR